ncbi:MAG: hypothetical protein JJT78_01465 [Leptospira sp.]|nr:hypothetical protein [Leptospira sp.]
MIRTSSSSKKEKVAGWIWISENIILRDVLSERFETDLFNRQEDFTKIASIEITNINSEIQATDSLLYSLATLTMGTFEIIDTDYTFTVKYLDGIKIEERKFSGKTQMTMKAPMPPYIGLGTTATLILLDRYKTPEHLQKYCIEEQPSSIREIVELKKNQYCEEYKKYIRSAWLSVEPKIEQDLKRRK